VPRCCLKVQTYKKINNGNRTYAITPHLPGGFIKPDLMRKYADVAEKYGGTAGSHPRLADLLIEGLDYDEVLRIVDVIIQYYQKNADIERVGQFIDRIGVKKFKADVFQKHADGYFETISNIGGFYYECIFRSYSLLAVS
jgi:NAD(P)H-nitrite reductase large subunit